MWLEGVVTDSRIRPGRNRLRWRATPKERRMRLPGDELVPAPLLQTTGAVMIDAPPQQVWPWLVQTGQGRAGFYSDSPFWDRCGDWYYRRLAREQPGTAEVGYRVAADDRVVASWQNLRVGDVIADGPPGTAYYVVRQAEPDRVFALFTDTHLPHLLPARLRDNPRLRIHGELSDAVVLSEVEPGRTRLVRRMRMTCGPWPFRLLAVPIVLVWGDWVTERNFLRGVKRRAERTVRDSPLPALDPESVLDRYLPEFDVRERQTRLLHADVGAVQAAIGQTDLTGIPVVRALLVLRALPGRLRARLGGRRATPVPPPFTLAGAPTWFEPRTTLAGSIRNSPRSTTPKWWAAVPTTWKACCVVAAHLAERLHAVLVRGMPYVVCDTDGSPVDPATAKRIIAERWTVPLEVRARRRSRKPAAGQRGTPTPGTKAGKAPHQVHPGHERSDARGADERGDLPRRASSAAIPDPVKPTPVAAAR